ncbi:MAG: hypothetical protein HRU80_16255 [Ignavibacteriales bacterium]|nr:MAG: hypothetical protein HRU80_16255 [Ignavibacteriales bacterium]
MKNERMKNATVFFNAKGAKCSAKYRRGKAAQLGRRLNGCWRSADFNGSEKNFSLLSYNF